MNSLKKGRGMCALGNKYNKTNNNTNILSRCLHIPREAVTKTQKHNKREK